MRTNRLAKPFTPAVDPWTATQYYKRAVETGQHDKAKLWRDKAIELGELGVNDFYQAPRPGHRSHAEPLSRWELDNMAPEVRALGLKYGHLEVRNGMLCERSTS